MPSTLRYQMTQFQSTPSAWRVTGRVCSLGHVLGISIHTLRMEGDRFFSACCSAVGLFQSTPSAWRVTANLALGFQGDEISIHTLRVEGDCKSAQKSRTLLFKVTDLRRNCRPDVHERTEGSLWQAVFAG